MPTSSSTILRRILTLVAIFGILGVGAVGVQLLAASPCSIPKTWSVGRVDSQFGLSKQMVAQYGKETTDIWNTAHMDSPLFTYKEKGGEITLNFVYDERMKTTLQEQRLKRIIDEGKSQLSDIKQTLASLQAEYASLGQTISSLTKAYNNHLTTYNKEVAYWNGQGGAPKDTYIQLQSEESKLEDERTSLNAKISSYNQLGQKIRDYGKDHNQVVVSLNNKINTLNQDAGREFEEGVYDPNNNSVTIYEYDSPISLKRVLTHEFGHSLSIGHVAGENSIMYSINQGRSLTLSAEDLVALSAVCKKNNVSDLLSSSRIILGIIRDDISRLVGSSSPDTAVQSK